MPRKRIAVIGDEYTATAFRMLGVEAFIVHSGAEAREALQKLLERSDVGVVLVASDFVDSVRDIMEKVRLERNDVVVTSLPTPRNPGKPVDMRRLLLQALGFGG